ncbi:MAG: hypothetical protein IBX60_04315 [Candidatus Aminicenantes bacterium]|nr:hypothetical protein [Candidatus Aminicenantes bacterium]
MTSKKSQYFQTIARYYMELRGAPFFLSPKEMDLVDRWERKGIPLRVAIEGIKNAFDVRQKVSRSKKSIFSLSFSHPHVMKSFALYQERKVGGRSKPVMAETQRSKIMEAVKGFLNALPIQVAYLKQVYIQVRNILSKEDLDEKELEELEERIEGLIVQNADEEVMKCMKKEVKVEYELESGDEFNRILRIKLVKHTREKYKIPYVSSFYY